MAPLSPFALSHEGGFRATEAILSAAGEEAGSEPGVDGTKPAGLWLIGAVRGALDGFKFGSSRVSQLAISLANTTSSLLRQLKRLSCRSSDEVVFCCAGSREGKKCCARSHQDSI